MTLIYIGCHQKYSTDIQQAIDRNVLELVSLIERKYTSAHSGVASNTTSQHSKPKVFLDFGQITHFYTLDCLGDFAFGESFGLLQKDEDILRMTEVVDLSLRMITVAGLIPWLADIRFKWPFKYFMPKEGDKVGFGVLYG